MIWISSLCGPPSVQGELTLLLQGLFTAMVTDQRDTDDIVFNRSDRARWIRADERNLKCMSPS